MARHARNEILYDGCFAHVYSRAMGKQFVFRKDKDFEFFKLLVIQSKRKGRYRIHHYCLMNSHFHLAVSIPHLNSFSSALKELKQRYATYVLKAYDWQGPIWWGRFKSRLIEDESYLHALGLYIEGNPILAGMVQNAEDWLHSSARHYLLGEKDPLIDPYELPQAEKSQEILKTFDLMEGSVIGSELFKIHLEDLSP